MIAAQNLTECFPRLQRRKSSFGNEHRKYMICRFMNFQTVIPDLKRNSFLESIVLSIVLQKLDVSVSYDVVSYMRDSIVLSQ